MDPMSGAPGVGRGDLENFDDGEFNDIDYLAGTDPDTIELGPDAVAIDLSRTDGDPPPTAADEVLPSGRPAVPSGRFVTLAVLSLAFLMVGFGLSMFLANRGDRPSTTDLGFVQDMIDHHEQATYMARIALAKPSLAPQVRTFALEVLDSQRWEVGVLDSYLERWDKERGDPERAAMAWMGMSSSVGSMPGIQTADAIDQLLNAAGPEADRLFLVMMSAHHAGGVAMADYAVEHASSDGVADLAAVMARNQRAEVREYSLMAQRLGLELPDTSSGHTGHPSAATEPGAS